uniref:Uncharacterized protein n=1 Tax=Cacopsylla melanoneura TaxID=428564 RepID=A0A8D9F706_9HEMI
MTETSPCSLYTRFSIPEAKLGSTGQLVRGTQARIVSLTTEIYTLSLLHDALPISYIQADAYFLGPTDKILSILLGTNTFNPTVDCLTRKKCPWHQRYLIITIKPKYLRVSFVIGSLGFDAMMIVFYLKEQTIDKDSCFRLVSPHHLALALKLTLKVPL